MRSTQARSISREEIKKAVREFLERGGHVITLPRQNIKTLTIIGEEKYSAYESLQELHF